MLQPLANRVVLKPGEEEEVTKGGIVLPDTAKKKPQEGHVLAVGPGKLLDNGQRVPMEVSVGDVVVYSKYSGTEITVGAEDYVIVEEDSILAVDPDGRAKAKKKRSA
jgi:chaperonin GroES